MAGTYETPPGAADAAGLEDYVAEVRGGNRIGTIVATVEEDGRRWLVVEQGTPPFRRDRRRVPASEIESVDHDALVVTLRSDPGIAPPLDPAQEREGSGAEATRVTEPVEAPSFVPTGDVAGPTDRTGLWFAAFASLAIGLLLLLGLIVGLSLGSGDDGALWALLAVPAVLLAIGSVLGYRLWRSPYSGERR